jgi:hypothetical protein
LRKLNPGSQALLVLAQLRKGETPATGFGVGAAAAWRYVTLRREALFVRVGVRPSPPSCRSRAVKLGHVESVLGSRQQVQHAYNFALPLSGAPLGRMGVGLSTAKLLWLWLNCRDVVSRRGGLVFGAGRVWRGRTSVF